MSNNNLNQTTSKNQFKCKKCNCCFTTADNLRKHMNRINPCDVTHSCKKCGKEFNSASLLRRHETRKTSCVPTEVPVITKNNTENKCHLCGKSYATASSLKRHQKNGCPMKNNQNALIQLLIQRQEEDRQRQEEDRQERQLLREAITNLGVQIPASNVVNNTLNIQNNTYVNVTICSFGNEDLSKLDAAEVMELLKGRIEDFVPKMIEHVHANPKHPERHNVFYDPTKGKAIIFVPISDMEMSWQMCEFQEISARLTKRLKDHMHPLNSPYYNIAAKNKDYDTTNKIERMAQEMNWMDPEILEKSKTSLSQLTKNKDFMNLVDNDESL